MSRLKQLIQEVHRRSLWQVLGIYVIGGWLVLQAVDTLAGALNLPEWAPPLALFLLIIGLPIVLATAIVQEGMGRREPGEMETTSGGTPIPSTGTDGTHHRLFTWRNAVLGGMGAFALWGVGSAIWLLAGSPGAGSSRSDGAAIESIAVLKFVNMSGDEENEYFAAGMSEQLLDALAKVPGLRVAARTSSFQFQGENLDVRDVGEKLDVEAVLEGSVRRDQDRIRITAQLVSAEDGFHVWSETYDRRMVGIFDLQDEITRSIVDALRLQLPGGDTIRLVTAPTESMDAYDLYLRARHVWNQRTRDGTERALEYFREAIALDSTYALAWAGLADTYSVMQNWGYMPSSEALPPAREAAQLAMALDDGLAEAHAARGLVALQEGDPETAEVSFRRAVEINPNYPSAHQWYGNALLALGRREEALAETRTAHALDPLSPVISASLAALLARSLHWEEALAQYDETLEIDPAFGMAYRLQALILANAGRFEEALALARRARALNPETPQVAMTPADVLASARDYDAALDEALPVLEAFPDVGATYFTTGLYVSYVETGRYDEALALLDRGSQLAPPSFHFLFDLGRAYVAAHGGDRGGALQYLDRVEAELAQSPLPATMAMATSAAVYAQLADHDRAFELLESLYEADPWELAALRVWAGYDPLRDDPRFDDLLVRMGLDDASLTWLDEREAAPDRAGS